MITLDGWGIIALLFFGWLLIESGRRALIMFLAGREADQFERLRARQGWLHALPATEWRPSTQLAVPVHEECGQRHRPWEWCAVRPGDPAGGRWVDGDGG